MHYTTCVQHVDVELTQARPNPLATKGLPSQTVEHILNGPSHFHMATEPCVAILPLGPLLSNKTLSVGWNDVRLSHFHMATKPCVCDPWCWSISWQQKL